MADECMEDSLAKLSGRLKCLPKHMKTFSSCMRSLYVEKAVGTDSKAAKEMRQLRDLTRNDAVVYLQCVLPLTTERVAEIEDFFDSYTVLDKDEWWENIDDIVKETLAHKEACNVLIEIHTYFLKILKQREDTAKIVVETLKNLAGKYEKEVKELEGKAAESMEWAELLEDYPGINIIAYLYFQPLARSHTLSAVGKKTESEIHFAAAKSVTDVLIPALKGFISGLEDIAGFFAVVHRELAGFEKKGKCAKNAIEPMDRHYKLMKKSADGIINECKGFYAVLPTVRSDFEAIPKEGTDQNYVDKWLEEQEKIIWRTCSIKGIAAKLVSSVSQAIHPSTSKATAGSAEC